MMPSIRPEDPLARATVAKPCSASWEAMPGGDRVRSCEHCRKKVYNLSAMTADEARALVQEAEGGRSVCVRFYRRFDGTVMTQDCPVGLARVRQRVAKAAMAVLSSVFIGGSGFIRLAQWYARPMPVTMGAIGGPAPGPMSLLPEPPPVDFPLILNRVGGAPGPEQPVVLPPRRNELPMAPNSFCSPPRFIGLPSGQEGFPCYGDKECEDIDRKIREVKRPEQTHLGQPAENYRSDPFAPLPVSKNS